MSTSRGLGRGLASLIVVPDEPSTPAPAPATKPDTVTAAASDRTRRRRAIELASHRPSPGTSDLLSVPMSQEVTGHIGKGIITYDVIRLAPIHLIGGEVDREIKNRGRK